MIRPAVILILLAALCVDADARDPAQVRAFRKANPCPSTGKTVGACPGYVVDHMIPLCLQPLFSSPLDAKENMQWQALGPSYRKDVSERAACRRLKSLQVVDTGGTG